MDGNWVPVAAFAMAVAIILISNITNFHVRRLKSQERLAAIEKGILLPEEDSLAATPDPRSRGSVKTRLAAIILIAVGIGTAVAFVVLAWILQQRPVLSVAAFAIIPFVIGIGLLIDYRLQCRKLDATQSTDS